MGSEWRTLVENLIDWYERRYGFTRVQAMKSLKADICFLEEDDKVQEKNWGREFTSWKYIPL